ncbi:MAG: hypothetical protein KQJ78_23490 [Deltaproteobacteria bacterium]|nr:hypothetical protein [Deltaproteobacteria bacterium]
MTATGQNTPPKSTWSGLLLAGVMVLLLAVLGITTYSRLQRTEELMRHALSIQGSLIVQTLEGALRAGLRHHMPREQILPSLVEEVSLQPHLKDITIISPRGRVVAFGCGEAVGGADAGGQLLKKLPQAARTAVDRLEPLDLFLDGRYVVGRAFEPLRGGGMGLGLGRGRGGRWMGGRGMGPGAGVATPEPSAPAGQATSGGMMPYCAPGGTQALPAEEGQNGADAAVETQPKAYALVTLSTAAYEEARTNDLWQAYTLALVIFVVGGGAGLFLVLYARRREREVDRLRDEVAAQGHLAAVGRLAASVAHEVRNPLSALRGLVQFLAKGQEAGSRQAEMAQVAVEEVDRLERVVSGLLEYTRPREPQRLPLDLEESARAAVDFLAGDPLRAGVEVDLTVEPNLPVVQADPDQVRQIILNLVMNALEAMNGQGKLGLALRRAGAQVIMEVSDSGPGLPPGEPEQLFDLFYSTKERGTGLGLALARRMARAHGGDLTATAGPRGGAKFVFSLLVAES